jgi:outer membrane protein OmpA-like peptidoglycan-associated protein
METKNIIVSAALTLLISGCANMNYKQQAALKGAAAGTIIGGGIGGGVAATQDGENRFAIGGPVGATTGAIIGGLLGYWLAEEPKPPPPTPPPLPEKPKPIPPPPPPAKPKPPPAPPPPPPPAPKVERTILLDDVLFDFDKSTIKPEGAAILDRLVSFMNDNKNAKVSLSGYTDNIGTEAYNLKLSDRRWTSGRDYLVKKGVDSSRVSGQGFGETKPIADNKTAEGRAKNRRVEIKVQ